jgi:hypothetical protein
LKILEVPEIKNELWSNYIRLTKQVINELDSLPKIYASLLRDINNENFKQKIDIFKEKVSVKYLQNIVDWANSLDEKEEELIISEEF